MVSTSTYQKASDLHLLRPAGFRIRVCISNIRERERERSHGGEVDKTLEALSEREAGEGGLRESDAERE